MFGFLKPKYLRHGQAVWKNGKKILAYKRDLLKQDRVAMLERELKELRDALKARDAKRSEKAMQSVDEAFGKCVPREAHPEWKENTEVFLVAIVIALGVRAYFLQPFSIPTGSMQPTLNGLIGRPTDTPPPNIAKRAFDFVWYGRTYLHVVAKADDEIVGFREFRRLRFFTLTEIQCRNASYTVHANEATLRSGFRLGPGRQIVKGEAFVRGYVDAGDSLFVNKFSYYFRQPRRGEVFVFNTQGIGYIERKLRAQGQEGSQFYIKRLAALPGDTVRIDGKGNVRAADPGLLFINGKRAEEPGFVRVMSGKDGYNGYANAGDFATPSAQVRIGPGRYLALGDNSYNSEDGRMWGTVPERNLTGVATFVYWPFGHHFGPIR